MQSLRENSHLERVLVLGGDGMLGHQLVRVLVKNYNVTFTVRGL